MAGRQATLSESSSPARFHIRQEACRRLRPAEISAAKRFAAVKDAEVRFESSSTIASHVARSRIPRQRILCEQRIKWRTFTDVDTLDTKTMSADVADRSTQGQIPFQTLAMQRGRRVLETISYSLDGDRMIIGAEGTSEVRIRDDIRDTSDIWPEYRCSAQVTRRLVSHLGNKLIIECRLKIALLAVLPFTTGSIEQFMSGAISPSHGAMACLFSESESLCRRD